QFNQVRDGGVLSNELHRILALAALDFLHLRDVPLSVLLLPDDTENIIHDDGHNARQAVIQVTGCEAGYDGNEDGVHGEGENVQLISFRECAPQLSEDEAKE